MKRKSTFSQYVMVTISVLLSPFLLPGIASYICEEFIGIDPVSTRPAAVAISLMAPIGVGGTLLLFEDDIPLSQTPRLWHISERL